MKKNFNDNLNINLFQKFDKFPEIEKDITFFEENSRRIFDAIEAPKKTYQALIKNKYREYLLETPKKMTEEDRKTIEVEYKAIIELKNKVEDKIDLAEFGIKKSMDKRGAEYILPIVKNKKLKRASKRFFGENKTEITFDDYQKALKRKKELEKVESSSFMESPED